MTSPPSTARASAPESRSDRGSRSILAAVPERRRAAPGRAFIALLLAILGGGLVGLLVLNTAMQRAAFALDALDQQATSLDVRRQVLELKVGRLQSPAALGRRASELGMVPMTSPAFLLLADGTILGDPQAAVAGSGLALGPAPPAQPAQPPAQPPGPQQRSQQQSQQSAQQKSHQSGQQPDGQPEGPLR